METGGPGENHLLTTSHWQLSHMPWPGFEPSQRWETAGSQWQRLSPHGILGRPLYQKHFITTQRNLSLKSPNKSYKSRYNVFHFVWNLSSSALTSVQYSSDYMWSSIRFTSNKDILCPLSRFWWVNKFVNSRITFTTVGSFEFPKMISTSQSLKWFFSHIVLSICWPFPTRWHLRTLYEHICLCFHTPTSTFTRFMFNFWYPLYSVCGLLPFRYVLFWNQ